MNNISFKSSIKPVGIQEFSSAIRSYGARNFIDYPWTIKQSIYSDKVYTRGIEDCTFLGITDGQKVLGMHICPTVKENFDFKKIKNFIESKIDFTNQFLQGIIIGGRRYSENNMSFRLFDYIEKLLETHKIPYSKLKDGNVPNDVAYSSITDEWLISDELINNQQIKKTCSAEDFLRTSFNEVIISEVDEVKW